VADNVLDRFVPAFRVQSVLDRVGGFDEVVDVDAGTFAQDLPYETAIIPFG